MFRLRHLHPLIGMALALVLAFSSGAMSVAAGKMRDSRGHMVLCTGHGPLTLRTDGRGHPVHGAAPCPDGIPAFAALMPDAPEPPALLVLSGLEILWPEAPLRIGISGPVPQARDPPSVA